MGLLKEFKEFAVRGNVVDLAVAVIIGGAFGQIITSFVNDVITPLLLNPALEAANLKDIAELTIFGTVKYGNFLSNVINFIIIAFVLFMMIKGISSLKKKEEVAPAAPPAPSNEEKLLTEIRDLLKNK
ncbi:MAG: large-conductance mechanosensitive channel protein MscL [Bacteroidetes bacterium]|nr:large-conductance mechanosensitive channel protein MscL [Bacteroidota bacterium]